MFPAQVLMGISGGHSQAPMFAAAGTLDPDRATTGSAVLNMSRQIGSALGVDLLAALTATNTRAGDTIYVSGFPPFDPDTGKVAADASIQRQTELVLDQLKACVEAAGWSLDKVLKCNIYCT